MLRKLLTEPLLHFLLLGLGLFLLYEAVSPDRNAERQIVVAVATVNQLSEQFRSVWLRTPEPAELEVMIENYIREEVLYREGMALGLDQGDAVIRSHVLQKLEVLGEETGSLSAPTDAQLQEHLQQNSARYAQPSTLGLQQVLFDPVRQGSALQSNMDAALSALAAGADPATLGDRSLLPTVMTEVPLDRLAFEFGDDFAVAVTALPLQIWQGPVRSGFGMHLVRVDNRTEARNATLEEVRPAIERDWENARRVAANEEFYQNLRRGYDVRIETPLEPPR